MPVRSLNSSVLVWPNRAQVDAAVRQWAVTASSSHPELRRLGYFGSYARGDWGVGSDLDLVAIVKATIEPRDRRSFTWDLTPLPVPAEILIYDDDEWRQLEAGGRFGRTLNREVIWILP